MTTNSVCKYVVAVYVEIYHVQGEALDQSEYGLSEEAMTSSSSCFAFRKGTAYALIPYEA